MAGPRHRPLAEVIADCQREYATLVEVVPPLAPDVVRFDDVLAEEPDARWPLDEIPGPSTHPFLAGDPDALD